MSAFSFKTIIVKDGGGTIRKEGVLSSLSNDIVPGMFVERSGENFSTVALATTLEGHRTVAEENELIPDGSTDYSIDQAYDTAGERVLYRYCTGGTEVFAWLDAGESVVPGDILEIAANGSLQAQTNGVGIALAMETVDNSLGASMVRILVEMR